MSDPRHDVVEHLPLLAKKVQHHNLRVLQLLVVTRKGNVGNEEEIRSLKEDNL
jgi:hypothetical protein